MSERNQTEGFERGTASDDAVVAVLHGAQAWTSAQGRLLCGVEAMWADWLKRQRATIDVSARSLQRLCECRTIADLVKVQQRWLADAVEHGMSDVSALANDAAAVMRLVAAAEVPAAAASGRRSPAREKPDDAAEARQLQREAAE